MPVLLWILASFGLLYQDDIDVSLLIYENTGIRFLTVSSILLLFGWVCVGGGGWYKRGGEG